MANRSPEKTQAQPLMPHATATWLLHNTSLTFQQIAAFCQIHILEVQAIADETAAARLAPSDPIRAGELTQAEIDKGQNDSNYRLRIAEGPQQSRRTSGPRYTPAAKRQSKPDGIAWILRHHPDITDSQISRLIGTTKTTINAIRNREHWNIANITPKDPVTLGLCTQRELNALVADVARRTGTDLEQPQDQQLRADREAILAELEAERDARQSGAEDAETAPHIEPTAETLFRRPSEGED